MTLARVARSRPQHTRSKLETFVPRLTFCNGAQAVGMECLCRSWTKKWRQFVRLRIGRLSQQVQTEYLNLVTGRRSQITQIQSCVSRRGSGAMSMGYQPPRSNLCRHVPPKTSESRLEGALTNPINLLHLKYSQTHEELRIE